MERKTLLQVKKISKKYTQKDVQVTILDDINFELKEGEILGVIGRSGSGKSTILRVISGLIEPSEGEVLYHEKPVGEVESRMSMIFQTFGLIPWLNIFENVTIGLDKKKFTEKQIKEKGEKAINLVGLRGYEEAYPKELSGGMRQRVGFARAMVVDPEILLMDEPFSALDYLTGNALKTDLLDLWYERNILSIKSIVIVTHSIEEAVKLCDKVIVLSSNPGRILANVDINLVHPRDASSSQFIETVSNLYAIMTNTNGAHHNENAKKNYPQTSPIINLIHFIEELRAKFDNNSTNIASLIDLLKLENITILNYIDDLRLLRFIEVEQDNIRLSSSGNIFLDADNDSRKKIFREHVVANIQFIGTIYNMLNNSANHTIVREDLINILMQKFVTEDSQKILKTTISWLRFAELATYDDVKEELILDNLVN
ncbi:Aliphatic sulfonates import ATP-binding protein SsuB [Candidatus Arcanobacter lacustris]|jgi:NitT/TauT family transport system ATP-binding protein|uniref:Aliphatic sulfonates import ATP-binding protein SsuB n=1 Tax=Candidatus Arcanibacter lacustris TaxID=1607817 RepID=A0A0F5MNB6_9RICK|nr:Aliphatic sulfonates import ATP-binding protein SsuB [Candidatus Arcanobacter lacustris]